MCIIETNHFLARWAERVGEYYRSRLHKLIFRAIQRGEHRRNRKPELGILVPIRFRGRNVCIVGVPEEGEFILRSVLTEEQAGRMGWDR